MAVAFPVDGGKLTILDTTGHFYTGSEYGILFAKDIGTAVNEWTQWISRANPNAQLTFIFSHTELQRFTNLDEFINWVPSNDHRMVELFPDTDIIVFKTIYISGDPIMNNFEVDLYYKLLMNTAFVSTITFGDP